MGFGTYVRNFEDLRDVIMELSDEQKKKYDELRDTYNEAADYISYLQDMLDDEGVVYDKEKFDEID